MVVSAVILSYNRCEEVLITLGKLYAIKESYSFTLEIIVVDNASADDTVFRVEIAYPDVRLVKIESNNGIAGWNSGFAVASGTYMLVLDDDSHIESGLEHAVAYLQLHPQIGILALQIKGEEPLSGEPLPDGAWQHEQELVGFIGCGAIITRELYQKIGGYAEWIYLYTHEFEYGIRCLDAGFRIVFFGTCYIVHRTSAINRSLKRTRTYALRNELAIIYKYFGSKRIKYMFRTIVNNFKFIKKEGPGTAWYLTRGIAGFFKMKARLGHTPVSPQIQNFYSENFWSAKPILNKSKLRK